MKRCTYVLVVMLLLGLVAGCGPTTTTGLPTYVVFAGAELTSSYYAMAVGIGDLISEHTPMTAKVESIGRGHVWLPLFETGEADLALMSDDDAYRAYLGQDAYDEPTDGQGYDFRTLQVGSQLLAGALVRNDSEIWRVADLRGKKVPSGFGGMPSQVRAWESLLANGGLTYDDVVPVPVATGYGPDIKDAFVEGRIDCLLASIGSALVTELDATVGVRFITIETTPEALAAMREWRIYSPYELKAGSFPGVRDDIYIRASDILLIARTTLSDDVVHQIMNTLWENYEELAPLHPLFENWVSERFATIAATVPFHPGAISFYKEKGVWTSDLEEHQQNLLALK